MVVVVVVVVGGEAVFLTGPNSKFAPVGCMFFEIWTFTQAQRRISKKKKDFLYVSLIANDLPASGLCPDVYYYETTNQGSG